jgi:hypothetical protein
MWMRPPSCAQFSQVINLPPPTAFLSLLLLPITNISLSSVTFPLPPSLWPLYFGYLPSVTPKSLAPTSRRGRYCRPDFGAGVSFPCTLAVKSASLPQFLFCPLRFCFCISVTFLRLRQSRLLLPQDVVVIAGLTLEPELAFLVYLSSPLTTTHPVPIPPSPVFALPQFVAYVSPFNETPFAPPTEQPGSPFFA